MKSSKAEKILPPELLRALQEYVQGELLYIPRADGIRRRWGEGTRIREELSERNQAIRAAHQEGWKVAALALEFYLSEESIRKILYQKDKKEPRVK